MKKVFENLKELVEFDFSELTPSKSNYLTINSLPKLKKNQNFGKWRVVAKPKTDVTPRVLMEITPQWLTISLYQDGALKSRRINIPCFRKDIKSIITGIFEI